MLYMLLRLRQACSHPWLVQGGANKLKQASAGELGEGGLFEPGMNDRKNNGSLIEDTKAFSQELFCPLLHNIGSLANI